ncbi:class I SAM-dependent methyltransferase [Helicobacter sp. 11S02629-2]|uniref:class I SAM-dependent methyltransferase n=1 Tax=Helicobacter sp. 11S02629-2 TaxID=1476195 RepID=UPI000BA5A705|nr:class I SAM-dependent methyltransferase [Helicobacter sp. 11S02629-2]PAF44383.1 hypothetical protein BKH40_05670 [Helicobacter sp. 11S02629-2]
MVDDKNQKNNILEDVKNYWDARSQSYSELNNKELQSFKSQAWEELIRANVDIKEGMKVLDCGCGPGFFSVLLCKLLCKVTSIDYSEDMLARAKINANTHLSTNKPEFFKMDAQNLDFKDESFDLVISRNLTWNLPNPPRAYKEWLRVLKKGGTLLIFDGNWYLHLSDSKQKERFDEVRKELAKRGLEDHMSRTKDGVDTKIMEDIAKDLFFSYHKRPEWDKQFFQDMGLRVMIDEDIARRVYDDLELLTYNSNLPFMIKVLK